MIETVVLAAIQGLTEFLPVSSSGHLALVSLFLGVQEQVAIAVILHFGTMLATIVYFRRVLADLIRGVARGDRGAIRLVLLLVVASIPAGVFGILFQNLIEDSFSDPWLVGLLLGVTGLVLLLTLLARSKEKELGYVPALVIGVGQMLAVFPGLSRSGMTIAAGRYCGVAPVKAFEFSMLLSLPAILGANVLELRTVTAAIPAAEAVVGLAVSFSIGLGALWLLRRLVERHFHLFGIYCLLVSLFMVLFGR